MWHPEQYLQQLYEQTRPKYSFQATNKDEWRQWRDNLKQQFIEDLGGFPQSPAELEPVLIEEVAHEDYIRKRVEIQTYAGLRMPLYLLLPLNSQLVVAEAAAHTARDEQSRLKLPVVIACHGHGYGSKEIVGLTKDGAPNADSPTYQKNFAIELVKKGFIVIAPELLGFGDRMLKTDWEKNKPKSCYPISNFLLQMGYTMAGYRVYETMRAIDFALTLPQVNPERVGCMGISGGGLVAGFTAALDERIQAAVVSGYVNTFKASILAMEHCLDNYVPRLNQHAEMPDLIGLIAPRPLLVEAGKKDHIFPIEATMDSIEQISTIYRVLGAEDMVDKDIFDGEHEINGTAAYDWLVRHLS